MTRKIISIFILLLLTVSSNASSAFGYLDNIKTDNRLIVAVDRIDVACPFTGGGNKTLIDLTTGGVIFSYSNGLAWRTSFDISGSLPAGKYKVSLASSDGYTTRVSTTGQDKEKYHVEFLNSSGNYITKTNSTVDLEDGVAVAEWSGVVNNELNITQNVAKFRVVQSAATDTSSPNSIMATCILLEPIEDDPTCDGISIDNTTIYTTGSYGSVTKKVNFTCSATGTDSYNVNCGNGTNINSKTGACNYTSTGIYTIGCGIDGDNPISICEKQVIVKSVSEPEATCDSLTLTNASIYTSNTSGSVKKSTTFMCNATGADSYKVNCGNGIIGTSNTGQCSYSTAGSYEVTCSVDDNITSSSCIKSVIVKSVSPLIQVDKTALDGSDSQLVGIGDSANFKIKVTNIGSESLKDIKLSDTLASTCAGTVTLPSTKPSSFKSFSVGPSVNYGSNGGANAERYDNLLQPGENFTYTCSKSNTRSGYTNLVKVSAKGVITGTSVVDTDTSVVTVQSTSPTITIDERDGNNSDLDSVVGNDTQTVSRGNQAIYIVKVTNNSNEALTNIVLSNTVAPLCSGSITLPLTKPSSWSSFKHIGNGDNKLDPGEYFSYKCIKANTTSSYKNSTKVTAIGVQSSKSVNDTDDTKVILGSTGGSTNTSPSISIDKRDANSLDRDEYIGNDTQTVGSGDTATFKVTVTNNGTEGLKNLEITDGVTPLCGGLITLPLNKPSSWSRFKHIGNGDSVFNPGETFSYTCTKSGTKSKYTSRASVEGKGVTSKTKVTDSDPTVVRINEIEPSITVDKTDDNSRYDTDGRTLNDTQTVSIGDKSIFKITITNNGVEALKNIKLTDDIDSDCGGEITLPLTKPDSWLKYKLIGNYNSTFDPGEVISYSCTKTNTKNSYKTEISVEGVGVTSSKTVSDEDPTVVKILDGATSCNSLSVSKTSGINTLATTVKCSGKNVSTFKIECGNGQVFTGNGSDSGTDSLSKLCVYTSVGKYTPKCYIDDSITNNSCKKTVEVLKKSVTPELETCSLDQLECRETSIKGFYRYNKIIGESCKGGGIGRICKIKEEPKVEIKFSELYDEYKNYVEKKERLTEINNLKNTIGVSSITNPRILPKTGTPLLSRVSSVTNSKLDLVPDENLFRLADKYIENISFWTQILPNEDKNRDEYIVVPSSGLVVPVNKVPNNTSDYSNLVNGREIKVNNYLKDGVLTYPETTKNGFGGVGNKVVFGHSSYWKSDNGRYKNQFQKIIELDGGEEIWVYKKLNNGQYKRYRYKVENSYNTRASDVSVLSPGAGSNLTLFTCTPIGGIEGRWVVKASYIYEDELAVRSYLYGLKLSSKQKSSINKLILQIKQYNKDERKEVIIKVYKKILTLESKKGKSNFYNYLKMKLAIAYYSL